MLLEIDTLINSLNGSKFLWGISMLVVNIGSRYIVGDIGKFHEMILTTEIFKIFIIFCMFFVATRDIVIAFILDMIYVIVIDGLLNEKRRYSIVKMDSSKITEKEYEKAKETVQKYESQQQTEDNCNFYQNYLNNISLLN